MKNTKYKELRIKVDNYSLYSLSFENPGSKYKNPVVLVHGLSVSSKYMIPTATILSKYCNVYILDFPGYGESTKPSKILNISELAVILGKWMTKMGVKKAVLLGNSLGCQIIVDFIIHNQKRATHAVLIGPSMDATHKSLIGHMIGFLKDLTKEPLFSFIPMMTDYIKAGLRRTIITAEMALKDPIEKKLPLVKVPVLVVRGELDGIVSQEWVEKVHSLLPKSKLIVIKGAAHIVNYNSPAMLVKEVKKFLKI